VAGRSISDNRNLNSLKPVDDDLAASARKVILSVDTLAANRVITDAIDPRIRTAYKILRTRLLQVMRANKWQSIAVTSASQGDGKTITAINLAISIAGDVNHNVCLVDLDLRRSSIADYLGLELAQGVSDCIQRNVPLSKVVVKPSIERLLILPNKRTEVHSSEILSSPLMQELNRKLKQDPSRIVIYDMPPVLAADDMLAFAPNIDAVLFVAAQGNTVRTDVVKAYELLENVHIIGTVFNHSDEKTAAYY
jgi:protein-tyrosine kinase